MRIFIIHNLYQHRGGEDVVFENETRLLSAAHEVKTFTVQNQKGKTGLRQFFSYCWNRGIASDILQEIQSFQPDVIHLHNLHYVLGPYLIRKISKAGYPIVMTLHNYRLICPSATLFYNGALFTDSIRQDFPWQAVRLKVLDGSFIKTIYTAFIYYLHRKIGTFESVDRFIVLSQFAKNNFLKSKLGLAAEKFIVKPNFVSPPALQVKKTDSYFIYIGRLSEEKGIIPLLKSLANTEFRLKVFGSGPQQDLACELIKHHSNLEYGGFLPQEELLIQLAGAEALIVPSICYEGMPMTILDAFALGIPVIASQIGILAEMVVPLSTGALYNPFDPASIRKTLTDWQLLEDEKKDAISKNCRDEFRNKYTPEINNSLLEAIYHQVIHTKTTET